MNGVLLVDKPEGPTSHDVVGQVRRALGTRRVGHTGTLDPFASGLLLVCVGEATRLAEYLTALPKQYVATMRLGVTTDTDDRTGTPVATSEGWRQLSCDAVEAALGRQVGTILQRPPAYSAKKVQGERMYTVARRGGVVEAEPVPVTIHDIEVLRCELPEVEFRVDCASGTYIRAIARDVGETLGVGAHLTALRRTRIGSFDVKDAGDELLPPAVALGHLPAVTLDEEQEAAVRHGRPVTGEAPPDTPVAMKSARGDLVAVGERVGDRIQPRKVFA